MRKRKPLLYLLFISLFSLASLFYLIFFFPPKFSVPLYAIEIPILPIAFFALFIFIWPLFWFILANKRQSFLIALGLLVFLILRLYNLNQLLFPILIIILILGIEILFKERSKL